MDANKMTEVFEPQSVDFLLVERITINPFGGPKQAGETIEPSLSYEGLLLQARQMLKRGGKLILIGADLGMYGTKYNFHSQDMQKLFDKHGFKAVLSVEDRDSFLSDDMTATTWFAERE